MLEAPCVTSGTDAQELDEFIAKGITGTGEGFDAPSMGRLGAGGFGGHNPSPALLRNKMLQVGGRPTSRSLVLQVAKNSSLPILLHGCTL